MVFNTLQSSEEELKIDTLPDEVQEEFRECLNIPFIKYMVSPDRKRAKDLPRDAKGRIIVDITKPHILEDMDYFRPAAIHYQKTGRYTDLKPNSNPNSAFGKWITEEVRRCWEGYVRESDGEWIPGRMYFFLNYCPISQTKIVAGSNKGQRVIDFPEVWDGIYLRYHYIEQAQRGGLYDETGGKNGCEISARGKAHPYSQIVYTPEGKKLWKDIKVGDTLFGTDGKCTRVTAIPYDEESDIYEVTLKDGRKVRCTKEHLWTVHRRHSKKSALQTVSTEEIIKTLYYNRKVSKRNPKGKEYLWAIPRNMGVDWEEQQTAVDPYVFGLLLGDGCFRHKSCYYTCETKDFEEIYEHIPYKAVKWSGKFAYRLVIPDWLNILKNYGLYYKKSADKFIPEEYLYNSRKVRLALLQGIMDSDGFVDCNGIPTIGISSKQLAENIVFVARSLGYNCLCSKKAGGYKVNGVLKHCLDSYIIRIYTNDRIFTLSRKLAKLTDFVSTYSRSNRDFSTIIDIKYVGKEMAKCVSVDSADDCYLIGDFITTHNSKSYTMASIMACYFELGESEEVNKAVKVMAMANTKEFLTNDGILTKFQSYLDFIAQNTEFPHLLLKNSLQEMAWTMGWKDTDGNRHGTMNEASGVAIKDDVGKTRGKRMNFIVGEEFGTFKNIRDIYNITLPSVIEGGISFGQIYLIGTSGENESDFQQAMEIVYNPEGYNMYALPNCWDKSGEGRKHITFFYPEYLNRKGYYDRNGNSNVTAAIIELLMNRYRVKYNTTDTNTLVRTIAERPITPQEAMLRSRGNRFPTNDLNTRLSEIDNNSRFYDDVLVGNLIFKDDKVEFVPSADLPIRIFPTEDNKVAGAIEIFELPDKTVKIPLNRYILGVDPVDSDEAATMSLFSVFVLDLWTDRIVAEYTGRQQYADDNFEIARRLALFYNGTILYESNIKGMFAYFSKMGCLHLLADTPEYLIDKQMAKAGNIGNQSKGVRATKPINDYADELTLQWLIQPETVVEKDDNGEEHEVTKRHLFSLKNRALIQEFIKYRPFGNYDRVRAFGMLMLYREKFMVQYGGEIDKREEQYTDSKANDIFFTRNFS